MWEIALSLHVLHRTGDLPGFRQWRGFAKQLLKAEPRVRESAVQLGRLCPEANYFPDFVTPTTPTHSRRQGAEAVSATPRDVMRAQLDRTPGADSRLRADLCDGAEPARRDLAAALAAYYHALIRPIGSGIVAGAHADSTMRWHALQSGGLTSPSRLPDRPADHGSAVLHAGVVWTARTAVR